MKKRALAVTSAVVLLAAGLGFARSQSPGNPLGAAAAVDLAFDAVVVEELPAGGYLYLRVVEQGRGHERWLATLGALTPRGLSRVHVQAFAQARGFHSNRLDRDFDALWFAAVQPAVQPKEP